jgi:hypothetical protein
LALILFSVFFSACGDSISKSDLQNCWAYEFIAGDIAAARGNTRQSINHYNAKNAFQKIAEDSGKWSDKEFKGAADALMRYSKEGNSSEIQKIGQACKKIVDSNKDFRREYDALYVPTR